MPKTEIQPYPKSYKPKPEFLLMNKAHKLLLNFQIQADHLIPVRRTGQVFINKKKKKKKKKEKACCIVNFAVSADDSMKVKESEKEISTLTFVWRQRKLWNTEVTMIPIVT